MRRRRFDFTPWTLCGMLPTLMDVFDCPSRTQRYLQRDLHYAYGIACIGALLRMGANDFISIRLIYQFCF